MKKYHRLRSIETIDISCQCQYFSFKTLVSIVLGRSRKDPHSPHGGNFCRPEGEGRKIVSDNRKCIRTSKGDRGVNFQFPPWGWWMFSGMTHWVFGISPSLTNDKKALDWFNYLKENFELWCFEWRPFVRTFEEVSSGGQVNCMNLGFILVNIKATM